VIACDRELNFNRDRLKREWRSDRARTSYRLHWHTNCAVTLLHEMLKRKHRRGVATLCVSGGMGMALALENLV